MQYERRWIKEGISYSLPPKVTARSVRVGLSRSCPSAALTQFNSYNLVFVFSFSLCNKTRGAAVPSGFSTFSQCTSLRVIFQSQLWLSMMRNRDAAEFLRSSRQKRGATSQFGA